MDLLLPSSLNRVFSFIFDGGSQIVERGKMVETDNPPLALADLLSLMGGRPVNSSFRGLPVFQDHDRRLLGLRACQGYSSVLSANRGTSRSIHSFHAA